MKLFDNTPKGQRRNVYYTRGNLIAAGVVVALVALYFGGGFLHDFFYRTNKHCLYRELSYESPTEHFQYSKMKTILEELGASQGNTNLLSLDTGALRAKLLKNYSALKSAEIVRKIPWTLEVKLEERKPVAAIYGVYGTLVALLDAEGYVFQNMDAANVQPPNTVAIVKYNEAEQLPMGEVITEPHLKSALRLINTIGERKQLVGAGYRLSVMSINVQRERLECSLEGKSGNVVFKEDKNARRFIVAYFPNEPEVYNDTLDRLDLILGDLLQGGKVFSQVDLTLENNVFTR